MIFDPTETERFRRSTASVSLQAGIDQNRRRCHVCNKPKRIEGGIQKRGTSRHNPGTFTCKECRHG